MSARAASIRLGNTTIPLIESSAMPANAFAFASQGRVIAVVTGVSMPDSQSLSFISEHMEGSMSTDPVTDLAAAAADLITALQAAAPDERRTILAGISKACREHGIDAETAGRIAHLFNEITTSK